MCKMDGCKTHDNIVTHIAESISRPADQQTFGPATLE